MQIVIDIPEEFEEHFNSDRFEDSLQRVRFDIHKTIIAKKKVLSRKNEIEILDMLTDAFLSSVSLPKGHGRLSDMDELVKNIVKEYGVNSIHELPQDIKMFYDKFINSAPTILDATFDYKLKNYAFFRKEGEK